MSAQTSQTFTADGTFNVPVGVTSVQVEAWGGGGGGAGTAFTISGNRAGGGGAGGTYTKALNVAVNSGSQISVTVGNGGDGGFGAAGNPGETSIFASPIPVTAVGGNGGLLGTTGAGGAATAGVTFNGGAGGNATASVSGGGGGGAGASGSGGNASGATAGSGGAGGGGSGAAGLTGTGTGNSATVLSGGGGGSRTSGFSIGSIGGAGFRGQVIVTYTCPTYALTSAASATGPFCGPSASVVTIRSASMFTGTYTIKYNLSGATVATANTATVSFTAGSPGTGTFTTSTLNPGTTTITITSITNLSCTSNVSSNNTATVVVVPLPTVSAGNLISTCANNGAVNITQGATTANSTSALWTTSGSGTFQNANSLTLAEYTPSNADISAGSVQLTLTVNGIAPCTTASSNKTLTILPVPVVNNVSICVGDSGSLSSPTVCTNTSPISGGNRFPNTATTTGTGTAWALPANALSNDATYSTASVTSTSTGTANASTQLLLATNFGFTIPANATIVGIEAGIGRLATQIIGNVRDNSVTLVKAGAAIGTNHAVTATNWPTAEAVANYGSSSDLWGTTWTPAEINAGGFGVGLSVNLSATFFTTTTASVNYLELTVSYTVPGTMNWYTQSNVLIGTGLTFNPVGVPGSGLANTNTPGTTIFYAECATVPGCRTAASFTINPLPTVIFSEMQPVYCQTAPIVALTANHLGGTFTGAGITNTGPGTANFNPATAGIGPHTITFSFTDGNACTNTTSQNIAVNANVNYYADNDNDGFGDNNNVSVSCTGAPSGYILDNSDCNDAVVYYQDADSDGFGADIKIACGSVTNNIDCDDGIVYYLDADGDGYGSNTMVACGTVTQNNDCNDNAASAHPGASEIGYDLIDNDCDGLIDEGFPPKVTTLLTAQCGIILSAIDTPLYANLVAGAQGYRWKITKMIGGVTSGEVQYLDTPLRTMRLTQLANYAFNTSYRVEVGVYYAGYLQPYQASNCMVTTPAATTQLVNCSSTLLNMSDIIYADQVPFATGYRFRITDPVNPLNTQEISRNLRDFRMILINSFAVQYGKAYNVECCIRNTDGSYLPYGSVCTITTPLFPTTSIQESQCDNGLGAPYAVPDNNTLIYADSYPGAIGYAFKLVGLGLPPQGAVVVKTLRAFRLSDFAGAGLVAGSDYNVSVRMIFNTTDSDGPYGKVCTLTVPGLSKVVQDVQASSGWNATAFPNPFSESFLLSVDSKIKEAIHVKIYDLAGRLLEVFAVVPAEVESRNIGLNYPSGIYTIIVSQGDRQKAIRMIKR